jgi:hypothetical protein
VIKPAHVRAETGNTGKNIISSLDLMIFSRVVTQRLTAISEVTTVPSSIPAFTDQSRIFWAADEAVLNKVQKISP